MTDRREGGRIAILLNDGFADWETAFLSSTAVEFFGSGIRHLTPKGGPVTSIGRLTAMGDGAIADLSPDDYDALVVCGSDRWADAAPLDVSPQLKAAKDAGKVIGLICAGTLAGARAGLLDERPHTSNGAGWIDRRVPGYRGSAHYRDQPVAVRDGSLVTAPGSAPASFAIEVLSALLPGRQSEIAMAKAMFESEHRQGKPEASP